MSDRAERGTAAERHARAWLEARGLRFRAANYRCRWGEIDLVMQDGDLLVFVEVRYRRSGSHGGAVASIDRAKRQRLCRAAADYLAHVRDPGQATRFDVMALGPGERVQWIRGAFDADA